MKKTAAHLRIFVFVAAFLAPTLAWAQTGRITGTVLDSSGAAVSGAIISATDTATAVERTASSSTTGAYTIPALSPSVYVVTITKTGFRELKFDNVTLTVDQILTLDAQLSVAPVQSITVEVQGSQVAPLDTQDGTLSNVVEHQQMTELPLILRDPYQLVLLSPGVTQSDGLGGVSVNGARERNNNFLLDGMDNNDADVPGGLGGATSQNPDSTEEFRVLTNNFAPEFGRNNGAIIDVITRSGTNQFHGNLFYFGRWDALGARDFFNHQIDPDTGLVDPKNPYVRNLYGGSFGGPIKKDKTFFFINYQGDRFVTNLTNESTVPTAAFKTGIFTYTNPATGASQALDVTTPGVANNATGVSLDPLMQKIFALYPNPNVINDGATGTLFFPSESREKDEDSTIKIDQRIGNNNSLFVRYNYDWFSDPNAFHDDFLPGDLGAVSSSQRTQGLAIGLTTTISPTFTNEAKVGGNRLNLIFGCQGVSTFNSIGLIDPVGNGADYSLPIFSGFGCQSLGDTDEQSSKQGTYQFDDAMTKVVGGHTWKWGAEFRDVYSNNFTSFSSRAALSFNIYTDFGIPTLQNLNPGIDNNFIEDEVSSLLGIVNTQNQTQFFNRAGTRTPTDELNFRQHELGLYLQDTWKVRSNLSVTYGLRWEWYGVPFEAHGNLSNLFMDPSGDAPFTFTPVGPGSSRGLYKSYFGNVDPRVGFAWDPFKTGKTSVRGGAGVFSDRVYGNLVEDARGNPPFQPSLYNYIAYFEGPGPGAQLQNQTAPGNLAPSPEVDNGAGTFPDLFDQNLKSPWVFSWNLGVQRELGTRTTVEANYVGNHATRILRVVDGAPPQPALVSELLGAPYNIDPSVLQFDNLYFGYEDGVLPFDAVNNNAFVHTFTDQSSGHSWYNGLQIQFTERAFHGLTLQGAYTYAHALDDSSDPLVTTLGNGNYPVDSFNLRAEKGNSGFDTRHRGVINFVYQAPIGRGTDHLSEGPVGRVFEGWEIGGIAAWQTGLPYDIFGTADTLHTGIADRATIIGSLARPAGSPVNMTGPPLSAFNPDDETIMPIPWGIPSNAGRNHYYGPGINNWDLNLAKTTHLTEKVDFQLRFEFYNLFNRVQFAKPDNNIGDSTFGLSLSQVGQNDGTTGARQVQIGAKLRF